MRNKLRAARSLSMEEWRIFWQAWFLLLAVDWGLRVLPFRTLQGWMGRGVGRQEETEGVEQVIERTWRMVDIAARNHVCAMTCLRRSLALQRLLARQSIYTELRFGVKKEGMLQAHAWLEYQGYPVYEAKGTMADFSTLSRSTSSFEYAFQHTTNRGNGGC